MVNQLHACQPVREILLIRELLLRNLQSQFCYPSVILEFRKGFKNGWNFKHFREGIQSCSTFSIFEPLLRSKNAFITMIAWRLHFSVGFCIPYLSSLLLSSFIGEITCKVSSGAGGGTRTGHCLAWSSHSFA